MTPSGELRTLIALEKALNGQCSSTVCPMRLFGDDNPFNWKDGDCEQLLRHLGYNYRGTPRFNGPCPCHWVQVGKLTFEDILKAIYDRIDYLTPIVRKEALWRSFDSWSSRRFIVDDIKDAMKLMTGYLDK